MPTERLDKIQDQVMEFTGKVQEPVIDGLRNLTSKIEGRVPEVNLPFSDKLPTASELIDNQFGFAQRVLDSTKKFATDVVEAGTPAPKTTKKAAASK